MIILGNDYSTREFGIYESNNIFDYLKETRCKFCNTLLDGNIAKFYKHESGWSVDIIKEKVWIWFECPKCRHEWSINHLGVSRNQQIII